MKKILISLIILFLISGCTQAPITQPSSEPEVEVGEGVLTVDEEGTPQTDIFTISKGSSITFDKKKITLKELDFRNELTLTIDGTDFVFYETKITEIFKGLIITPQELHFDHQGMDTHAMIEILRFKPGQDEYLLYIDQEVNIPNKGKVILKDVSTTSLKSISIKVSNEIGTIDERVHKGETKDIFGVKITNIYPRARNIGYEKYALLKIE